MEQKKLYFKNMHSITETDNSERLHSECKLQTQKSGKYNLGLVARFYIYYITGKISKK